MDGYREEHSCRESKAGGASIYIKNSIQYMLCDIVGENLPCNMVSIKLVNDKLSIDHQSMMPKSL